MACTAVGLLASAASVLVWRAALLLISTAAKVLLLTLRLCSLRVERSRADGLPWCRLSNCAGVGCECCVKLCCVVRQRMEPI
jgi:hypothetical protein